MYNSPLKIDDIWIRACNNTFGHTRITCPKYLLNIDKY